MKLSIIIPCYNEGRCIKDNIQTKIFPFIDENKIDCEIIVVNDGSKDNTLEVLHEIKGIKVVTYPLNKGKGYAVKQGIANASGDYILFMDADLSTDLSAINLVLDNMNKYDFIIGSRHIKGSNLPCKQGVLRQFIGWSCRNMVNHKFKFHYKDTQCGFKAIKKDVAKQIIGCQIIDDFAFDVEYLYWAKLHNVEVLEIPVTWINDKSSTVKVGKSSIKFIKDMNKIKKNKTNYLKGENLNG